MFQRAGAHRGADVAITIDGMRTLAKSGDSVAAAMLAAGVLAVRATAVSGAPRGPYCMMGVCFDCLVSIDGVGNRQGCLIAVQDGMQVETQRSKREAGR